MDANKKKKIVIWVSLTMLLGVGGYFAYTKLIKPKLDEKKAKKAAELAAANTTPASTGNSAPSGGGNTLPPVPPNPFTGNDLKKFQDWVVGVKKDAAILGKTGADSNWGRNSWNAYTKYFAEYSKTPTGTTTGTTTGVPRKVYSLDYNNKVFKAPNDILPVFLAGKGEYLGDKIGSAKDYYGTDYIMYYTPDRKNMYYIKYSNAEIKA